MSSPARALAGFSEIAGNYDAALCDLWGVAHNGVAAYPSAVRALIEYRKAGGKLIFITNAPRPSPPIIELLDTLGVTRDAYDGIVSSGDATRSMIAEYAGKVVHHVGPPLIDDSLYEGLGVIRGPAEEAEVIVVTDLETDDDTPDMYNGRVDLWLKRGLPMICANPDRV
ncbi:MAG: TIGR01459 family HAD-type hydrolase, partial [Hyphomicrobiales bacterium]